MGDAEHSSIAFRWSPLPSPLSKFTNIRIAMRTMYRKTTQSILLLKAIIERTMVVVSIGIVSILMKKRHLQRNMRRRVYSRLDKIPAQIQNMSDLVKVSDEDCKNNLRMDRSTFHRLCYLLQHVGGLKPSKNITVAEKLAMFLSILAHHTKNRCVKFQFKRSGQTVSAHFHTTSAKWTTWRDSMAHNIMEPLGNAVGQECGKVKATRGRRSWTKVEEDALIRCLSDIVNDGWKAENGFRAGFQRELEKGIQKLLPGTDIVANPHINSKIHVWKKEYSALSDLLSRSGIGWNSTTSMIEVDDEEAWDASRRADPQIKGLRYKSWPYYSHWLEIFGKDMATGENAVDPIDLVNELVREGQEADGETGDGYVPFASEAHDDVVDTGVCLPTKAGVKSVCNGKKRIGSNSGQASDNKQLNNIMSRIVGLKVRDKLKVCDELIQNEKRLEFFFSLPEDEQEEYVWMLLDGSL
ncbi:hypothetical protein ACS0TY_023306 [Phlomoides rotata]